MGIPRVTLLNTDGTALDQDAQLLVLPHTGSDADVRFLSCRSLSGLRLFWPAPEALTGVRLWFLGCGETDVWNSWLRAPRIPPSGALQVWTTVEPTAQSTETALPVRESRFCAAARSVTPAQRHHDAVLVELSWPRITTRSLTLRLPAGPFALARVRWGQVAYHGVPFPPAPVPDRSSYPPSRSQLGKDGDELNRQILSGGTEPTLNDIWQLALPFRGGALLGSPRSTGDGPVAYQLWDGGVLCRPAPQPDAKDLPAFKLGAGRGDRVLLHVELDPEEALQASTQGLRQGFLPVGEVENRYADVTLRQQAYIDEAGELHLDLWAQNRGSSPRMLRLLALGSRRQVAENDRALHAEIHTAIPVRLIGDRLVLCDPDRSLQGDVLLPLPAGQEQRYALHLSLSPPSTASQSATAVAQGTTPSSLQRIEAAGHALVQAGAQLDLPDPHLQNLWRALLLHVPLFMQNGVLLYGLFPGVYEGGLFGVEEGWDIVALAQLGHTAPALSALQRTFFDREFLKKDGPHHQYRNGLAITYALDVFLLTGTAQALHTLWPQIADSAQWIVDSLRSTRLLAQDGQRPTHFGLMPQHIYGGDLRHPAYSLYASSACWRGLRDAARIAQIVGQPEVADRLRKEAEQARADLHTAAQAIYRAHGKPPYLPFATDEDGESPSSGDYYQLFASLILETAVFGWRSQTASALTRYLEDTGRMVLGIPRFDGWFGRLGIDAEYARGAQLAALQRRQFDRFYLGLMAQVALSCDPHTFVSPETAILLFSRDEYQDRMRALRWQGSRADSDPCSAGTGVMLQYLRLLLACEERDEDDLPTGTLWLGAAAPPSWFRSGQQFGCTRLPTLFGPITYRCRSDGNGVTYEIETSTAIRVEAFANFAGRRVSQTAVIYPRGSIVLGASSPVA